MTKRNKDYSKVLKAKTNKLDWHTFNLIENLLVFCVVKERSVPKESGVHFRISVDTNREAICILFKVDRSSDPLIKGEMARPDYMILYAEKSKCICTIVEMKGTNEKNLEHGIEQIKVLRDILREEFKANISTKFKVKFQGVLLTPFNSQVPVQKIAKEASNGLVILPLQYHHKAELFGYVSKENKLNERYEHRERGKEKGPEEYNFIEDILINMALPSRIKDSFYKRSYSGKDDGVYINYVLPDKNSYAVLAVDNSNLVIAINEEGSKYKNRILEELSKLGLRSSRNYKLETIS